jgi:hypothetical protein
MIFVLIEQIKFNVKKLSKHFFLCTWRRRFPLGAQLLACQIGPWPAFFIKAKDITYDPFCCLNNNSMYIRNLSQNRQFFSIF